MGIYICFNGTLAFGKDYRKILKLYTLYFPLSWAKYVHHLKNILKVQVLCIQDLGLKQRLQKNENGGLGFLNNF